MAEKGVIPKIGDLVADVWVTERHSRQLEATKNPVEYGSPITDHAYLLPKTLGVTFAVSNTPLHSNASFSTTSRVSDARNKLFELQDKAELLTVYTVTGGVYENCLITSISWETDATSANAVQFDLELEEILITKTKTTEYAPLPADPRTDKKTATDKKRGEVSSTSREEANEARRKNTADANASAEDLAKSESAKAQADAIAKADNRTLLKKITDKFL